MDHMTSCRAQTGKRTGFSPLLYILHEIKMFQNSIKGNILITATAILKHDIKMFPNSIIIKFRYNARADWLKQRALSEYRCTEMRCHAISPFANFLDFSLGFIYFIIIIFRSRRLL